MDQENTVVIRLGTWADFDALKTNAPDAGFAIEVNGELVAVTNEYGTATTKPGWDFPIKDEDRMAGAGSGNAIEELGEVAVHLLGHSERSVYTGDPYAGQDRGWVIVVHDVDTDIVWDVYNHEPTEEDIHSVVCDFWTRCNWDLPDKKPGRIYYTDEDMPDHCGLSVGRLGKSLGFPLSRS